MYDEKLSLREHIALSLRTLRLLNKIAPGITVLQFFQAFCKAIIPFIAIYMSARILTELVTNRDMYRLIVYVAVTIGSTLITVILQSTFGYFTSQMKVKITAQQEQMIANKTYALDYAKAENKKINELRKLIETHSENGVGGLFEAIWFSNNFLRSACALGIAFVLSAEMFLGVSWWMTTLLAIASAGVLVFICYNWSRVNKVIRKLYAAVTEASLLYDFFMVNYMDENKAAKDIRIFKQSEFINKELHQRMYLPQLKARKAQVREEGNNSVLTVGLTSVLGGFVFLLVTFQAWYGVIEVGDVVRYYGAITQLIAAASSLVVAFFALINNNYCLKKLYQYIDLPEQQQRGTLPLPEAQSAIELRGISFRYAEKAPLVLNNINLSIAPGEHVAIVGRNGSGKTTLIKLLCRLYVPTQGQITLNNVGVESYDYNAYQKYFSAVFQDFALFAFNIGQNVAGCVDYNETRVWKALELAGLKSRVEEFPKKLEHTIFKDFEEDGIELSGGEEQKLAIARALYKNAHFVILDEPTAALDPFSEAEIYNRFKQIAGQKTSVYISHRLSSCKFCDRIIVMDKGRIVQSGSHDKLLSDKAGEYAQLWYAQAQYYQ